MDARSLLILCPPTVLYKPVDILLWLQSNTIAHKQIKLENKWERILIRWSEIFEDILGFFFHLITHENKTEEKEEYRHANIKEETHGYMKRKLLETGSEP